MFCGIVLANKYRVYFIHFLLTCPSYPYDCSLYNLRARGVGSTFKLRGPLTSRALAWWKGHLTIGVRATFFFLGGGGVGAERPIAQL